ncbi:acetoacetate--CoA ligase [Bacterioplanes sanyensis]|uniref:Acetoacetate--CoA ligase n=1 Tax=Bacterioplanes sanyensis TaxID=1249553 RepID=A0A222FH58_9GAMM|nr:acetoacetate--CoA ligase [Bacterioplanes sanyensis]ASP37916.1 acetoacetate--CoA ligase [Bacterioplanes sanyensis]
MSTTALWQASQQRRQHSQLQHYMHWLAEQQQHNFEHYNELYQWSIEQRGEFWQSLWQYFDIQAHQPASQVLQESSDLRQTRWFEGARLNFAEHLLRPAMNDDTANKTALVFRSEQDIRTSLSYRQLYQQVEKAASAMRQRGVVAGDRVAAFMPNVPETVISMLAAASIGALFSSCSPDFGLNGVLDRFGQIQPKLLIATQGYFYAGKWIDCSERVAALRDALQLPAEQLISVPYPGCDSTPNGAWSWHEFLATHDDNNEFSELQFASLPFDHPLYIMYSSGTTGVPKCIVHGAGGTLLQHLKELRLHTDVGPDDVLFYFTTCGWMMWNWLVSGLATGATVVLYDGSPFHPGPEVLWQMAEDEGVTVFGTSAKYISALEKAEQRPIERPLKLRTLLSTGSPLAHESFDYVYNAIGRDLALCSISGGTDIISCFALGNPLLPVYRGELQCAGLGMAVDVCDEQGQSCPPGEKGELVCRHAFPSMPVGFWNDADGERYRSAYFDRFDGMWAHGDYAEFSAHQQDGHSWNSLIIHGRSDAVLNPGGVRIGTAEIYRQVEQLATVQESLAIGQQWQDDVRVVLFVVLADGLQLDDELRQQIRQRIREHCTPRHVPAKIIQVPALPRTISGKLVELAVRNVVHGEPVKNTDALANPQTLDYFKDIAELKQD